MICSSLLLTLIGGNYPWTSPMIRDYARRECTKYSSSIVSNNLLNHFRTDGLAVLPTKSLVSELRRLGLEPVVAHIRKEFAPGVYITVGEFKGNSPKDFASTLGDSLRRNIYRRGGIAPQGQDLSFTDPQAAKSYQEIRKTPSEFLRDYPGTLCETVYGHSRTEKNMCVLTIYVESQVYVKTVTRGWCLQSDTVLTNPLILKFKKDIDYDILADKLLTELNKELLYP